jgi:hypothetical protein
LSFFNPLFQRAGLPKALREAIQFLASNDVIDHLTVTLQDQLDQANPSSVQDRSQQLTWDHDPERIVDLEWSEGVDEFKELSIDNLYELLGFPNGDVPFFNSLQDPSGNNDPWTKEGMEWLQVPKNGEKLTPRWHQMVGSGKILINFFDGLPVMSMDGVGLGKTMQGTITISALAYYRDYHTKHGTFPGIFGELTLFTFPNVR